ncbi:MAG: hypothetical protein ACO37F_13185 [Pirellulales bacterium]
MGLRNQFENVARGKPPLKVTVAGLDVYIRCISIRERDVWEQTAAHVRDRTVDHLRSTYLAFVLCDESGQRLYGDDEIAEVGKLSSAVLGPLFDKALAYNRMSEADIRELAGESTPGQ